MEEQTVSLKESSQKGCESETISIAYSEPKRAVFTPNDIEKWEKSSAYQEILGFLIAMNESTKGKKLSHTCHESDIVKRLAELLDVINKYIDEFPPVDQPQRYGNKAFRQFYEKLKQSAESKLKEHLPIDFHAAVVEIAPYLTESLGNSTRIDYGTGHELAFIMFLCSLHKIGALKKEDSTATVLILFKSYILLCRRLQMTYKMEPAGSQGVWSLDDYQFIPFIWGSSQLIMNPKISPDMFTNENIIKENANEYLFFGCVEHILSVKTGPFAEHSNQLWNISGVKSWTKINQGLFKMYKAEILNKFPIIQHVLFGSIFSLAPAKATRFLPQMDMGLLKGSIGMIRPNPTTGIQPSSLENMMLTTCMMPPSSNKMPQTTIPAACVMPPVNNKMPPSAINATCVMPASSTKMPQLSDIASKTEALKAGLEKVSSSSVSN